MTSNRRSRQAARAEAAADDGLDDDAFDGWFGIFRVVLGRALNATRRAPEPIRRVLWGVRPPPRD